MDADELLDSMRALLIVVLGDGTIDQARGGFGGFLGLDVASLPGTNVFQYVPLTETEDLATYFIDGAEESAETLALPLPFRMTIIDGDGFGHPVDIVPTGRTNGEQAWAWTVLLVPVSLNGSITRSLDLEMAGAPRDVVRRMLCEELRVDNANYTSRWLMIDLHDPDQPSVIVARPDDRTIADVVAADLESEHWKPWEGLDSGAPSALDVSAFPDRTRSFMETQGWTRSIIAPVYANDRLTTIFVLLGRVPATYDPMRVKRNVASRIQSLVRATSMLVERWEDQDRLQVAASTDALTGLINRRELFASLESERRSGSLLFIDVDDFKRVNDRYGHAIGDGVLVQLARRIESGCRPQDRIGRIGGDEFVVVLPGADTALAEQIAQRIGDRVAEPLELQPDAELVISVSIGCAPLDGHDPLDAADHAMLDAKRRGRQLVASSGSA